MPGAIWSQALASHNEPDGITATDTSEVKAPGWPAAQSRSGRQIACASASETSTTRHEEPGRIVAAQPDLLTPVVIAEVREEPDQRADEVPEILVRGGLDRARHDADRAGHGMGSHGQLRHHPERAAAW